MPRMTNTYMLAGDDDPADILRSVKRGPVSYTHLDVYKRQPPHRAHHQPARAAGLVKARMATGVDAASAKQEVALSLIHIYIHHLLRVLIQKTARSRASYADLTCAELLFPAVDLLRKREAQ